jgi:hypothetical protein
MQRAIECINGFFIGKNFTAKVVVDIRLYQLKLLSLFQP